MEAWEIMISESQERMVAVVRAQMLHAVRDVCARWELPCTVVGEVTDDGALRAFHEGDVVGEIAARFLTDECPRYVVEGLPREPAEPTRRPRGYESKRWIYEQYDHLVGSRTVRRPGLDAAVLRLAPSMRGLAVSLQGGDFSHGPFAAGATAVFGAARNVACAGGRPIGFTDCLNFGNPEKPEIAWELAQAIDAIREAANALGIPVVSGNVSLYNETGGAPIPPTPVVGCVGLVRDVTRVPSGWRRGDRVYLVRGEAADLVRFAWQIAPRVSLLHDVSDGGIELALREAASWSGVDADLDHADGAGLILATGGAVDTDLELVELGTV
jgi:phosphoribosylformylglycinamidine (FGAM) synthase-like enzyme